RGLHHDRADPRGDPVTASAQPPVGDEVLDAVAEVMERQARVNRAEASLAGARQRLGESVGRLSRVASNRGVEVPPLVAAVIQHNEGLASPAERHAPPGERSATQGEHTATLRDRIVAVLDASPEQVFTPALVARALGTRNRDSVRNSLLVLA